MKENIGYLEGMIQGIGMNHGDRNDFKVFDWIKAVELINELHKSGDTIRAGLMEDWACTSGILIHSNKPLEEKSSTMHLSSSWATPILDIEGEEFECWIRHGDDPNSFDQGTFWPKVALDILDIKQ